MMLCWEIYEQKVDFRIHFMVSQPCYIICPIQSEDGGFIILAAKVCPKEWFIIKWVNKVKLDNQPC